MYHDLTKHPTLVEYKFILILRPSFYLLQQLSTRSCALLWSNDPVGAVCASPFLSFCSTHNVLDASGSTMPVPTLEERINHELGANADKPSSPLQLTTPTNHGHLTGMFGGLNAGTLTCTNDSFD